VAEPRRRFFATTSGGLEPFLEGELRALGAPRVRRVTGGVAFEGDRALMVRACVELRTAHRVLWVLGEVGAHDAEALYRGVHGLARWEGLCPPDRTLSVRATLGPGSGIRDGRFAALKVKDAIVDRVREAVGARPSVSEEADVRVRVRLHGGRATVSLDAAGQSLHARGYRQEGGEAPLRETLAAAVAMATRWDGRWPLIDPLAGSGTLLIEATLLARRIAPGLVGRRYGFERWPGHKPQHLEAALEDARTRVVPLGAAVLGRDRDPEALAGARHNAERAGLGGDLAWEVADALVAAAPPAGHGTLVTNPPWGGRLAVDEAWYPGLGRTLRETYRGWDAWVLVEDPAALAAIGLPVGRQLALRNGPVDLVLAQLRGAGGES
jgi:23S rRNA G2445 N2-methylase RlmL